VTNTQRQPQALRNLVRVHGRTLSSVLVLRGTAAGRDQVARVFHAASGHPAALFHRVDCASDETLLDSLFRALLSDAESSLPSPEDERTLFLDVVEALTNSSQRLLLLVIERLAEMAPCGERRPIGRLIAGCHEDLQEEVDAGRFLPELYDAINKIRVDLGRIGEQPDRAAP